jgi:hypothetical protein
MERPCSLFPTTIMSTPKNNLDDVRRRKNAVLAASSPAQPVVPKVCIHDSNRTTATDFIGKASKFKPALPSPASGPGGMSFIIIILIIKLIAVVVRTNPTSPSLSTFSTAGFGKAKPAPPVNPKREIVDLLSTETAPNSSSSHVPIKRTSSDSSVSSNESSSKRAKKENKENIFHSSSKGKGKAVLSSPRHSPVKKRPDSDDDEPWAKTVFDQERNPWTRLNRDFPLAPLPDPPVNPDTNYQHRPQDPFPRPTLTPAKTTPTSNNAHADLYSVSLEQLEI